MTKKQVDLIIDHAAQLVTVRGFSKTPASSASMSELGIIEDGAVAISNGAIDAVGKSSEINDSHTSVEKIDAAGRVVTPGLVDPHTHLVFAGSRERELEMKIKGATYMEILQEGGGILRTVRDTRQATREKLVETCRPRCLNLLLHGTTTAETKSGYGLTLADEIKMLEAIRELNLETSLSLVPTFLGAHAVPPEFEGKTSDYVREIYEDWIPKIAQEKLAVFCDVFCEKGVFEIKESRDILEAGSRHGLLPKVHADEFYPLGGAELAARVHAVSADHLLQSSSDGLRSMKDAGVIATLLPAAPLTLMLNRNADARAMIDMGLPVALGSDLSPSCWLENQQYVLSLACYELKLTPAEALTASTINAAHAIRKAHEIGSLEPGKLGDIVVWSAGDFRLLSYRLGTNLVDTVIKNGRVVVRDGRLSE